jgi:hypothetical protein
VTLTGRFLDPGSYASHSVRVRWGDNTSDTSVALVVGARSFTLTHQYLDENPPGTPSDVNQIGVTVTDNDSLTGTGTTSVTVINVPPQLRNVAVTRRSTRTVW